MNLQIILYHRKAEKSRLMLDNCGKMCYYTYTSEKSAGVDDTPVPCTIHENCVITKRELYYITTDAAHGCGCREFLLHHNIGRTHSEYTTHSAYGRLHTPLH